MRTLENLNISVPKSDKPRIVIIGGGFAGINLAKKINMHDFQVVMLDRNNYHTFQPLLYQVATAGLEPDSIAGPLRQIMDSKHDFYFRMARVTKIYPEKNMLSTMVGDLEYDFLVIANGSKTNYFGNETLADNTFPMKQVPQALDLRSQLLQNFEKAVMTEDPDDLQSLMNIVIVGGGPTGVELAGALAELRKHVLPNDYKDLDFKKMGIYLVEGQGRVLASMSEKSSIKAARYLKNLGVNVIVNDLVSSYDDNKAYLKKGGVIASSTVIWAAGVQGNVIEGLPKNAIEKNRIIVDEYNKVKGINNIFAIGDIALMQTEENPHGYPMLAPVAIQQARHLAKNLKRMKNERALEKFTYIDKGTMATIGRNKAVVDLPGKIQFGGMVAWIIWMFVHIASITGFRNKLIIFANWVWNYITYDHGTRLIIRLFLPELRQKLKDHI